MATKLATIGSRIKYAMECKNMSQANLCRLINIKSSSLSNLISGKAKSPSATTLLKLAAILEVSQEWIMTGTGEMSPVPIAATDAEAHKKFDLLTPDKKAAILAAIDAFLLTK